MPDCGMPMPAAHRASRQGVCGRRQAMDQALSFGELRAAIRAWRRYGFFSLTPREAEIIDAVYARLAARPPDRRSTTG